MIAKKVRRILDLKPQVYAILAPSESRSDKDETETRLTPEEKERCREYFDLVGAVELELIDAGTVVSDDPQVTQYIKDSIANRLKDIEQSGGELDDEEEEVLLAWFWAPEYCERMLKLRRLFSKHQIPENLESLIEEARRCLAMGFYTASISLSRTILEKAVTELAIQNHRIPPPGEADYFADYPPKARIFFDLAFVVAIAAPAHSLSSTSSPRALLKFAVLFPLLQWAWVGSTFFNNRFDVDGPGQRLATLMQMALLCWRPRPCTTGWPPTANIRAR